MNKFMSLSYEIAGVIADLREASGNDVCIQTLQKARETLADWADEAPPNVEGLMALVDDLAYEVQVLHWPSENSVGKRLAVEAYARRLAAPKHEA